MSSYINFEPTSLDEVVLPPLISQSLKEMQANGEIESMIFYGRPGTGKSLTARLLSANCLFLRCDGGRTPTEILATANGAGRTVSFFDDDAKKLIVFDELDSFNSAMQSKVRAVIDECGHNATFIATTNHIGKIIPALRSRLRPVCFDHEPGSITLRSAWEARLRKIHEQRFNFAISDSLLANALRHFPDGRQMITAITTRCLG